MVVRSDVERIRELLTAQEDPSPYRSSLSVDQGDVVVSTTAEAEEAEAGYDAEAPPMMDQRILQIIRSIPDRTIRPGRLAAELGISVEDASAELCGLLAAVGGGQDGASFRFETIATKLEAAAAATTASSSSATTMVFTFPPDFERRANRNRRKEDLRATLQKIGLVAVKVVKIVTAFGLILSLLILSVAAAIGVMAAIVALSRSEGGHRHRSILLHRVRTMFFTIRQMLWCYAVFAPTDESEDGNHDPFLKEVAYDLWLFFSVCCGNPGSIFFWIRSSQLQQRRRRGLFRSWGQRDRNSAESGVSGVTLVHRDGSHSEGSTSIIHNSGQPHRGLLSRVVEFLFGPTPFASRPAAAQIWILRAAALVQLSTKNQAAGASVSLTEMAPFVDFPPVSAEDSARIVEQGLLIVSHFNGIPTKEKGGGDESSVSRESENFDLRKARFAFPELMAESRVTTRYEHVEEKDDGSWEALLYDKSDTSSGRRTSGIPTYLKEERYKFTRLAPKQFLHCVVLGILNLVGVIWFGQSLSSGGVIEVVPGSPLAIFLLAWLLPVLKFYAVLFFAVPGARLLLIVVLNHFRQQRNKRRALLVSHTLGSS